jgi:hypothetical protein
VTLKKSILGSKSYPHDRVISVGLTTPKFTFRWLGIAGARLGFDEIRSSRRRSIDDGEALVG